MRPFRLIFVLLVLSLFLSSASAWNTNYGAWSYRQNITTTNNYAGTLDNTDNSIRIQLDTAALIAAGKLQADCDDLRIGDNAGGTVDFNFESGGCNATDTNIWFPLPASIANGATDSDYYIYYGNAGAAKFSTVDMPLPGVPNDYIVYENLKNAGMRTVAWTNSGGTSSQRVWGDKSWWVKPANGEIGVPLIPGAGEGYIDFWVKFATMNDGEILGIYTDNANRLQVSCNGAGKWNIWGNSGGVGWINTTGTASCVVGEYYNLKLQLGSTGLKFWVDGVLDITDADTYDYSDYAGAWQRIGCVGYDWGCDPGQPDARIDMVKERAVIDDGIFSQAAIDDYTKQPTTVLGVEQTQTGVTASFNYSILPTALDPENSITSVMIDLNDTSISSSGDVNGWTWDANIGTLLFSTSDQNNVLLFGDTNGQDVNISLAVEDTNNAKDGTSQEIHIPIYPQGVTFGYSPSGPAAGENVDFNGWTDLNTDIKAALFEFPDENVLGTDAVKSFSSSGNFNVCFHVQNLDDLNRSTCASVGVSGHMLLYFFDEDSMRQIAPTVTVNGTPTSLEADDSLLINLSSIIGTEEYDIYAYDVNRTGRHFIWDVNQFSFIDANAFLLEDVNGRSVTFKFYAPDKVTILGDAWVSVRVGQIDGNLASRIKTTVTGIATMFLKTLDSNYSFYIVDGSNDYLYIETDVEILKPKDACKDFIVTPFNIQVGGLGQQTITGATTPQHVYILSNTYSPDGGYYVIQVDANSEYLPRFYSIRTLGNAASYIIQPFLVSDADGFLSTFWVLDEENKTVPGVLVNLKRYEPGLGLITVESRQTDATGTTSMAYCALQSYQLEYVDDSGVSIQTFTNFVPDGSTDYTYIAAPSESGDEGQTQIGVDINFIPVANFIDSNGSTMLTVTVIDSNSLITSVHVLIENGATVLDNNTFTVSVSNGGQWDFNINGGALDASGLVKATVTVTTSMASFSASKAWVLKTAGVPSFFDLSGRVNEKYGPFLLGGLAILAILIVLGWVGTSLTTNITALSLLAAILIGVFIVIGWLPWVAGVFAIIAAIAGWLARGGT